MSRQAVLITGAAKRVGAGMARYFAANGYDIALHYRHSKTQAQALKKEFEKRGTACELFAQDLADIKSFPKWMERVQKAFPHCHTLINNASVFERAEFMKTDEALFDRQFNTNFKAPFFLTQAFAKQFKKGCVINILDTDIVQMQGSHFAYLLSKKALAQFTQMAARELGPKIRVNGVCPGIMLPSNELDKTYMSKLAKQLPLGTNATLKQLCANALWLCQEPGVTGQLVFSDGGQHLL